MRCFESFNAVHRIKHVIGVDDSIATGELHDATGRVRLEPRAGLRWLNLPAGAPERELTTADRYLSPTNTPLETYEFTDREVDVVLGLCRGKGTLPSKYIAEQFGITEDTVQHDEESILDKTGLSSRFDLFEFIKTALNGELRRRRKQRAN